MLAAVCLGFAGKYWMACLARFCGGFFNGIIGCAPEPIALGALRARFCRTAISAWPGCKVAAMRLWQAATALHRSLKTVVAETCPDSETQAFAMGYLSFGWGMGTIVGPAIGGLLSNPCGALLSHESPLCCGGGAHGLLPDDDALAAPAAAPLPADTLQDSDRDPHVCNGLLARFPFLLPCLAAAAGSAAAVVIVTALLQETLHVRAPPASAVPPRRRQARSKTWTLRRLLSCMCCCPGGGEAGFEMLAGDEEGVLGEKEKAGCEEELELELEMTAAPLRRSFSLTEAVHHLPAALGPCPGAGAAPPAGSSVGAGMSRREEGDERAGLLQITVHADSSAAVSPRHADSDPPVQEEAAPAAQPASVVYSDSPRPPDAHLPWYRQRDVQLTIAGYGLTAYLFNILDEVVPIYASAPHSKGGLGMPTQRLALPMSFSGVVLMLWALLCYPRLQRAIGPIRSANCGLFMLAPVALFIPAASLIASSATTAQVLLALALCLKNVSATNAFTSSMILVNTASPADALGSVNGAGQTLAAFVRAAGPATGGILWAASVQLATPGHQFLTFTLVAAAAWLSLLVYRFTHLPSVRLRWHQ